MLIGSTNFVACLLSLTLLLTALPCSAQRTESADWYVKRGVSQLVKGDYENAIADFDKALESNPDLGLSYLYRGKARQAKGDLDGAIEDYERAFRVDSRIVKVAADIAEIYRVRGSFRLEKLELDEAINDFDKAIRLRPHQADSYFQRGRAHLIDGDYAAAVSDFDHCVELEPMHARAYLSRGVAQMHRGYEREAREDFEKCRELRREPDFMLQMYILETELKIKDRRARRVSQAERIAMVKASRRLIYDRAVPIMTHVTGTSEAIEAFAAF
ncbi:MAG: tetratricopeptide repeat protein [Pyrinomonadaceae bacterium]|nr:tetratricopeptide repeat protein [Pyrinomonadaceae bacterium]